MGGGKWINYLFHFLSAILYLFNTLPQAKHLFHFLMMFFLLTKLDRKLGLVLMLELRRRANWGFTNLNVIQWSRTLKYLFTTCHSASIYFMKIQSQNIYLTNTSAPSPSWRLKGGPPYHIAPVPANTIIIQYLANAGPECQTLGQN